MCRRSRLGGGELARNGDWILHDGRANDRIKPFASKATNQRSQNKVLIFISPRKGNRDKENVGSYAERRVLSPFDEEEMLDIRAQVYDNQVDERTALARFEKIGGIPRLLFEIPLQIPGVLNKVQILSPYQVLNHIGELSSELAAIQPWWGGDMRHEFLLAKVRFASVVVADMITHTWRKGQWDDLVQGAFGNKEDKGTLFEIAMHNLIPQKSPTAPGLCLKDAYQIEYFRPWHEGIQVNIDVPKCKAVRIRGQCLRDNLDDLDRLQGVEAVYARPLCPHL